MAFWVAFIYSGAHAVGLREGQSLATEQQSLHFPQDYPDTAAGRQDNLETYTEVKGKHDKRPPAKNPNYAKLGRLHPFRCPWKELLEEWASRHGIESQGDTDNKQFFVLRKKSDLKVLDSCFTSEDRHLNKRCKRTKLMTGKGDNSEDLIRKLKDLVQNNPRTLVPVRVRMIGKGAPDAMATISIPTQDDISQYQTDKSFGGPVEPLHKDVKKKLEKELKQKAKKLKCQSVKKFVKRNIAEVTEDDGKILGSCTRTTIGYLNKGGFSLSSGAGSGVGFCAFTGLVELYSGSPSNSNIVLLRNPKSFQYRLANIEIMCS